jgi:hypothetical protein
MGKLKYLTGLQVLPLNRLFASSGLTRTRLLCGRNGIFIVPETISILKHMEKNVICVLTIESGYLKSRLLRHFPAPVRHESIQGTLPSTIAHCMLATARLYASLFQVMHPM